MKAVKSRFGALWLSAVLLCACWSAEIFAIPGCDEGGVPRVDNSLGDPESARSCVVMGRVFCSLTRSAVDGVSSQVAAAHALEWLNSLDRTGSHATPADYRPLVSSVAEYVYSHPAALPWNRYYYGVYTCGVGNHVGGDALKRAAAMEQWDVAAAACQQKFPGAGDGYGNDPYKLCLAAAMNAITGKQPKK